MHQFIYLEIKYKMRREMKKKSICIVLFIIEQSLLDQRYSIFFTLTFNLKKNCRYVAAEVQI